MTDILERLDDLILQATKERSHYYVRKVAEEAKAEIERLLHALRMIAGEVQCVDPLMSDKDIARAAIDAARNKS